MKNWFKKNWKQIAKVGYGILKVVTGGKVKIGGKTIPLPSQRSDLPESPLEIARRDVLSRSDENPLGLR
jgi:hypothetical protein